jgi:hypothetical protein
MTKSHEFTSVATEREFEAFLTQVSGLHDGIVREAALVARGYGRPRSDDVGDAEPADVVVVIQLQSGLRR